MKLITVLMTTLLTLTTYAHFDMKKEYSELKQSSQKQMKVIDKKLDKVKYKMSKLTGKAKIQMKDSYQSLLAMREDLEEKIDDGADVTEDKGEAFKDQVEELADNIEAKVEKNFNL